MLTAVVLCHNEAAILPRCLSSLKFCDQILLIDDESTDNSIQIAKSFQAKIISHSLNNDFAAQRNFALSQISTGWVLFIDADEEVPPELAHEILDRIQSPGLVGYYMNRWDFLWGRLLRHGDLQNFRILRLAKSGTGQWFGKVHETWSLEGETAILTRPLYHFPHQNIYQFLHQINRYSSIRAKEMFEQKKYSNLIQIALFPIGKFLYLYLGKLGFLDSVPGLIHSFCMSFYTFLVRGKLFLLRQGIGEYV